MFTRLRTHSSYLVSSAAVLVLLLATASGPVSVLRRATGIGDPDPAKDPDFKDLQGFFTASNNLVHPIVLIIIAVAPLALAVGLALLMFGGRKGTGIIVGTVGVVVAAGSFAGIVA
jgi:hypothetical protein